MVLYPNKLPESERVCSGICISRRLILIPPCKSQNTQISPCGTKSTQKMNEKPLETIIIW